MRCGKLDKILRIFLAVLLLNNNCFMSGWALPEGAQVANGQADLQTAANVMTITASDKAIVNYNSFSIASGEKVNVVLPSSGSRMLNRVLGGNFSDLRGELSCNGQFILINPAGIYMGPGARLDFGSLIMSTRDITDENFLNKNYVFEKTASLGQESAIVNSGAITLNEGGFCAMIAAAIKNNGTIVAPMGSIVLAGADKATIGIGEDGLISVAIDKKTENAPNDFNGEKIKTQIENTGTIEAQGGTILLQAESLPGIFEQSINLAGVTRASHVENVDGVIRLVADNKTVISSALDAKEVELAGKGAVELKGDQTYNDFTVTEPSKWLYFEAGKVYTFLGNLKIQGGYGELAHLISTQPGQAWYIDPRGELDLKYIWLQDSYNLRPEPIYLDASTNRGGNTNWIVDPIWIYNGGGTGNWSTGTNWDSGVAPSTLDTVTFNSSNNGNSLVDATWSSNEGTITNLAINGYSGTLTLGGDLTISNNFSMNSGTFDSGTGAYNFAAGNFSISGGTVNMNNSLWGIGSNWSNTGGTVNPGTSTIYFSNWAGTGPFNITSGGQSFNNVDINDYGTATTWRLQDAFRVLGTFDLTGGTLDDVTSSPINIAGNALFRFGTVFNPRNSVLTLDGSSAQTYEDFQYLGLTPYYDLVIANPAGVTLLSSYDDFCIQHSLTINSGATLVLYGGNAGLDFSALSTPNSAFTNNGTLQINGAPVLTNFYNDTAHGLVEYRGTAYQVGQMVAGAEYYDLLFNSGNGDIGIGADLTVNHKLTIGASDGIDMQGNNLTMGVGATFENNGELWLTGSEIFTNFVNDIDSGTVAYWNNTNLMPAGNDYWNLIVDANVTAPTNLRIRNNLTIAATCSLDIATNGVDINMTGAPANGFVNNGTFVLLGSETLTNLNYNGDGVVGYTGTGTTGLRLGNTYQGLFFSPDAPESWTLNNDLTIGSEGFWLDNNATLHVGSHTVSDAGNFDVDGTFDAGTGRVVMNNTTDKWIWNTGQFYDLTIASSAGAAATPASGLPINVSHNLTINSGSILDMVGETLSTTGATFVNNGTLRLQGAETLTGFANDTDSGTVEYNGTGTYTGLIAGNTYNNLLFDGTGTWILNNALTVNNNLTFASGTFDTSASNYAVDIGKAFSMSGASTVFNANGSTITVAGTGNTATDDIWNALSGTFNRDTSTVRLTGNGLLTIDTNTWAGNHIFYNLELASSGRTITLAPTGTYNPFVINLLTFNGGTVTGGSSAMTVNGIGADPLVINTGTVLDFATLYFDAGITTPINIPAYDYPSLSFNARWRDSTYNLAGDITCGDISMGAETGYTATLNAGGHDITAEGTAYIANGGDGDNVINLSGGNLTIGETLYLHYFSNGTTTLNSGTGTVTIGGEVNLNPSATGSSILNMDSSTWSVNYNNDIGWNSTAATVNPGTSTIYFNATGGNNIITSGGNTFNNVVFDDYDNVANGWANWQLQDALNVAGNLTFTDGTFDPQTYAVVLNGTGTQTLTTNAISLYDLTVNKSSGAVNLASALTLTHDLAVTSGNLNINSRNLSVTGAITNAGTITLVGAAAQNITYGSFTDNGTVNYNGGGYYTGLKLGNTYNNLQFSGTGSYTLNNALTVNGNLSITNVDADLDLGGNDLTLGGSSVFTNYGDFILSGTETLLNFNNDLNAAHGGYVAYNGSGTTGLAAGDQYVNLAFYNGDWVLDNNLTVGSFLYFAGNSLDVSSNNYTISIGGPLTMSGLFDARQGNVIFNGGNMVQLASSGIQFYDLTLANTDTYVYLSGDITVTHLLNIGADTTFVLNTSDLTLNNASLTNSGTFTAGTNAVNLTGTALQSINIGASSFYDLNVNNTGSGAQLTGAATVTNALNIGTGGLFDINGQNLTLDTATFSNEGTLRLQGSETVTGFTNDTNSGTIYYDGEEWGTPLAAGSNYYDLVIAGDSGSLYLNAPGNIDINHSLVLANSSLFSLVGYDLDMTGATFSNEGTLALTGAQTLTNFVNDTDSGRVMYWTSGTVNGLNAGNTYYDLGFDMGADATFNLTNNLTVNGDLSLNNYGGVPTLDLNGYNLTLSGTSSFANNGGVLRLQGSETLTHFTNDVANGGTVIYDGTSASPYNGLAAGNVYNNLTFSSASDSTWYLNNALTVNGDFTLDNADVILGGNALTLGGSFSNNGWLWMQGNETLTNFTNDTDSGTIVYNGSGTYPSLIGGNNYYNLEFRDGIGTYTLGGALSVVNNLRIDDGTIDFNGHDITIGGDFTVTDGTSATFANLGGRTIAVGGTATLNGQSGNLLNLNPTTDWYINATTDLTADYANIGHSQATGHAGTQTNSTNSFNNTNWNFSGISLYWVGGTGAWSDALNHWATVSGGTPDAANTPGAGDGVFFDSNSGIGTCTLDAAVLVAALSMSSDTDMTVDTSVVNSYAMTISGDLAIQGGNLNLNNSAVSIGGDASFAANALDDATSTITFNAVSGTNTITSNGNDFNNVVFNDANGATSGWATWQLQDDFNAADININSGTVDTGAGINSGIYVNTGDFRVGGSATLNMNQSLLTMYGYGPITTMEDVNGTTQYYDVLIDNGWGVDYVSAANNLNITHGLTIINGSDFNIGTSSLNMTGAASDAFVNHGILTMDAGVTLTNFHNDITDGTIAYNGSGTYDHFEGGNEYYNLSTGGANFSLSDDLIVHNSMSLSGSIDLRDGSNVSHNIFVGGNLSVYFGFSGQEGTLTFNGTSPQIFLDNNGGNQYYNVVIDNPTTVTLQTGSAIDITNGLTINSGATLDLNGTSAIDFSLAPAGAFSNNGRLRLQGNETLTSFANDINSGIVEYYGTNTGVAHNIAETGVTDFYDLIINDQNATADTFNLAADCSVAHDFTLSGGNFDTNALNRTLTAGRDFTVNGGNFKANGSTINVGRNLAIAGIDGLLSGDSSTFVLTGSGNIANGYWTNMFCNLTQNNGVATTLIDDIYLSGTLTTGDATSSIKASGNDSNIAFYHGAPLINNGTIWGGGTNKLTLWEESGDSLPGGDYGDSNIVFSKCDTGFVLTGDVVTTGGMLVFDNGAGLGYFDTNGYDVSVGSLDIGAGYGGDNCGYMSLSGASTLTVAGDLNISSNIGTQHNSLVVAAGGTNTINVGGSWYAGDDAVFDAQSSTVNFNAASGTKNITSGGQSFNNVIFNDANNATDGWANWQLQDALNVAGNLTFTDGTFDPQTFAVNLNGSGTQTLTTNAVSLYDLTVNKSSGEVNLASNLDVNHGLTITAGTLDLSGYNLDMTGAVGGFNNTGTLRLQGGETLTNFTNDTDSGTVDYDGAGSYTGARAGNTYNNVKITGGGTYTINDTLTVNGAASIDNGVLDMNGNNGSIGGAFSNNGTLRLWGSETTIVGNNDTDSGTVEYYGPGSYTLAFPYAYYNVNFLNGTYTSTLPITVNNDLTIGSGTLDLNGNNLALDAGSVFTNNGTLRLQGSETLTNFTQDTDSGTVSYDGTGTYTSLNAGNTYYNLSMDGTGDYTLNNALRVNNDLALNNGTLSTSASNYAVDIGKAFSMSGASTVFNANGSTITVSGTGNTATDNIWYAPSGMFNYGTSRVRLTGNGILSTNTSTGTDRFYDLELASLGRTITLNPLGYGINTVMNTLAFNGGTVTDEGYLYDIAIMGANANPLSITAGSVLDFRYIYFDGTSPAPVNIPAYAYPSLWFAASNASQTYDLAGDITASNIEMMAEPGYTVTFDAQGHNIAANDIMAGNGGNGDYVINLSGGNLTLAGVLWMHLSSQGDTIFNAGSGTITVGREVDLNYTGDGTTTLNMDSSTWRVGYLRNDIYWSAAGATVNPGTSTVYFNAIYGNNTITSGGNTFNNVIFDDPNNATDGWANWQLQDALNVAGNLTFTDGTFDPQTYAVVLNGAGTQALTTNAVSLYDLTVNKSVGVANLASNLDVNHGLTITAGTLDLSGYNLDMTGAVGGFNNTGTLRLRNTETLTNVTNDTNSGTIEYNAYYSWGAPVLGYDYYNVIFHGTDNIGIANNLRIRNSMNIASDCVLQIGSYNIDMTGAPANGFVNEGVLVLNGSQTLTNFNNDIDSGEIRYYQWNGGTFNTLAAGNTYYDLTFYSAGGSYTSTYDLPFNIDVNHSLNLVQPRVTLDLNGHNLDMTSATFSNDGTLRLQGGETLTNFTNDTANGGTVEYDGAGTYTGLRAGNSYANLVFSGSGTYTLNNALSTNNDLSINAGTLDLNSNNITVGGDFTVTNGGSSTFANLGGRTITVGGTATLNGQPGNLLNLNPGTDWNIAATADLTANYANIGNSHATVHAGTATHSTNSLNNTNWNFTSISLYWVGGAGSWSDALNHWATVSGGTPDAGNLPGSTDNVFFDVNSGTGTCTLDVAVMVAALSMSSDTDMTLDTCAVNNYAMTISGDLAIQGGNLNLNNSAVNLGGDIILAVSTLNAGTSTVTLNGTSDQTLTTNAASLYDLTINKSAGTATLADALTVNNNLTLTNGTFDTSASDYAVNIGKAFSMSGASTVFNANGSTITVSGTGNTASDDIWSVSSGTFNAGTSTVNLDGNGKFNGLTTFYNLEWASSGRTITYDNYAPRVGNILTFNGGTVSDLDLGSGVVIASANTNPLVVAAGSVMDFASLHFIPSTDAVINLPAFDAYPYLVLEASTSDANYRLSSGGLTCAAISVSPDSGRTLTLDFNGEDLIAQGGATLGGTSGSVTTVSLNGGNLTAYALDISPSGDFTFNAGTGLIDITQNVIISSGSPSAIINMDSSSWNVGGMWSGLGTINPGTSTITFDATSGTNMILPRGQSFNNVIFDDANGATDGWATWQLATSSLNVAGNLTFTDGTFDPQTYAVVLNGTGTQTLTTNAVSLYNLTVSKASGAVDLGSNLTVTSVLNVADNSSYLDLNGYNLTLTGATFSNDGTLRLQGSETLTNFANDTNSGRVLYDGTGTYAGLNAGNTYYNLAFDAAGTYTLNNTLTVNNDFTLNTGNVDTSAANSYGVNVTRDFTLNGGVFTANGSTINAGRNVLIADSSASFVRGTSLVNMIGTGTISNTQWNNDFYRLALAASGQITTAAGNFRARFLELGDGTFDVEGATFIVAGAGSTTGDKVVTATANSRVTGGVFHVGGITPGSTVTMDGFDATGASVGILNGIRTVRMVTRDLVCDSFSLSGDDTTFDLNDLDLTVSGAMTIGSGVNTSDFYAGTGTIRTGSLSFSGTGATLHLESANLYCSGTFNTASAANIVDAGISTVTFDAVSGTNNIALYGNALNNVVFDDADNAANGWANWQLQDALNVAGNLTFTDGTFDPQTFAVNLNGSGTQTLTANAVSLYDLTVDKSAGIANLASNLDINHGLTITAGTLDLSGQNLTLSTAAFSNTGTLRLRGTETLSGFTNDTNSGTVSYDGTDTYASLNAGNTYYNLSMDGTGSYTLNNALTVNNNLTLTSGAFDTGTDYAVNIGKAFSMSGASTVFNANGSTITVQGLGNTASDDIWNAGANSIFNYGTSTVRLTGNGVFTIDYNNWDTNQDFYNLELASSGQTITLGPTQTYFSPVINHILSFNGGTVTDNGNEYWMAVNINTSDPIAIAAGSVLDFDSLFLSTESVSAVNLPAYTYPTVGLYAGSVDATYNLQGDSVFSGDIDLTANGLGETDTLNFNGHNVTVNSFITSNGGAGDSIVNLGGGNLTVGGNMYLNYASSGTTTFNAGLGTVTVSSNAIFNLGGTGNTIMNMDSSTWNIGVINGDGNFSMADSTVNSGTSTVNFGWSWGNNIIASGGNSFNNVIFNDADDAANGWATWQLQDALNVAGNLTFTDGTFDPQTYAVVLNGTGTQTLTTNAVSLYDLTVNKSAGTVNLASNLDVNHGLTITAGTLDLSGYNLDMTGAVGGFNNTGTLRLQGGETLTDFTNDINSGTIYYDGVGDFTGLAAGDDYFDLTIANTGRMNLTNDLRVRDLLTLNSGIGFYSDTYDVNLTGATLENNSWFQTARTTPFTGFTNDIDSGMISYTGNISGALPAGNDYWQFGVNDGANVVLSEDIRIRNGLYNYGSILDLNGHNVDTTGASFNDDYTNATLRLQGNEVLTNFQNPSTTDMLFEYYGFGTHTGLNAGDSYRYLSFSGTGTYDLDNALTVSNDLNINSGNLNIANYDLTVTGDMVNAGTLSLEGAVTQNISTGTFTDNGTVNYNGNSSYTGLLLGNTYNALSFSGSGDYILNNDLTVAGDLTITSGTLDIAGQTVTVTGDLENTGTLALNGIAGQITASSIDVSGGTVEYNGGGSYANLSLGNAYGDLTFSGAGTYDLGANLTVNGGLTVSSGILDLNNRNLNLTGAFNNTGTLRLLGSETLTGFANDTDSGSVVYDGAGSYGSLAAGNAYNDLTFNNTGSYTAGGNMTVNGNLNINSGIVNLAANNLAMGGASVFSNTAALWLDGSQTLTNFTNDTDSGTVVYNGAGTYASLAAGNTYNNLTLNNTGTYNLNNALTVNSALNLNSGTLDLNNRNLTLSGAFNNTGTLRLQGAETLTGFTNDTNSGTVEYDGASSYNGLAAGNTYNALAFSGTGTYDLNNNLTVNSGLAINSGILDLNSNNLNLTGAFNNTGILRLQGAETLTGFTNDTNSGTVYYDGTGTYTGLNAGNAYWNLTVATSGHTYDLNADLDVNNNFTIAAGDVDLNGYNLDMTGTGVFSNNGSLEMTGTEILTNFTNDNNSGEILYYGAAAANIGNIGGFYNLTCNTAGKTLNFVSGVTQAVNGTMNLHGADGNLLTIQGSVPGSEWLLNPAGGISVDYLNVIDSHNLAADIYLNNGLLSNAIGWILGTAPVIIVPPVVPPVIPPVDPPLPPVVPPVVEPPSTGGGDVGGGDVVIPPGDVVGGGSDGGIVGGGDTPAGELVTGGGTTLGDDSGEAYSYYGGGGFDVNLLYQEGDKKYKRAYVPGKYRTTVIVFEGKVVPGEYNDCGVKYNEGGAMLPGAKGVFEQKIGK